MKIKAILTAMALVLAALFTAAPAMALGKVKCDRQMQPAVSIGNIDPIVNHDGNGSMHEHQFFGNIAFHSLANPDYANYDDLVGKDNNCRMVLGLNYSADSAGYWVPTLRYISGPHKGELVPAQQFTAYYRAFNGATFGPGQAFPADTRLVAQDNSGPGAHGWTCGQKSTQARQQGPVQFIPDCTGESGKPGHTLTAHVTFPSCWDGVLPNHHASDVGDTEDTAHYAYPVRKHCPAGFSHEMVQLRETIQFAYTGNGSDVRLSSDAMDPSARNGATMHGDFWNAWRQPEFEQFIKTCVTSNANYSAGKCDP